MVWQCSDCTLRFTQDVPGEDSIGPYYQSQDYISHSNISKGLLNKLYQRVRKHTLKQKADFIIQQTKREGSLLDVGAGTGAFAHTMKMRGWQVKGIEPDAGARKIAQELFGMQLSPSMDEAQLRSNSYDAISLWHVLEHVHQLNDYVETLKSLLTADGKIFIAVPNYMAADADIYKTYWAAYDVPRHLYHFSPRSIEVLVQKHGLKLISKHPMWFDSFYISLLSSKYKRGGKASWIGAGMSGLRSNFTAMADKDRCSSVLYVIGKY